MAYQNNQIDAILATSLSDDPLLMRELHQAFLASAADHLQALCQAPTVPEWHMAAWRFKGLCASFGVTDLADLAAEATEAPIRDPELMQRIRTALETLDLDD